MPVVWKNAIEPTATDDADDDDGGDADDVFVCLESAYPPRRCWGHDSANGNAGDDYDDNADDDNYNMIICLGFSFLPRRTIELNSTRWQHNKLLFKWLGSNSYCLFRHQCNSHRGGNFTATAMPIRRAVGYWEKRHGAPVHLVGSGLLASFGFCDDQIVHTISHCLHII